MEMTNRELTEAEVENLAALYADMTQSGEITGTDEAFDTVGALHGYEIADRVCSYLNRWGNPRNTNLWPVVR